MFKRYLNVPGVRPVLLMLAEAAMVFAVLFFFLEGFRRDFRVPLYFSADALEYLMQVKGTLENGWWWVHPRLSAPGVFGQVEFPSSPNVDQAIVWLVGLFTDEAGLAINASWMLIVVLSALVASRCLVYLNVSRWVAIPLGLLYAVSPYALYRQIDHFSLATHLVPMAATVALLLATGRLGPLRHPRVWPLLVGTVLLGLNYTYYPFFACFLVLVASVIGGVALRRWRDLGRGVAIVGAISLATAINLAPSYYAWAKNGEPTGFPPKRAAESEQYGLKVRHLISPIHEHTFTWFRSWTELEKTAYFPLDNENETDRLGLVASIGFLALLGALFVPALATRSADGPLFLSAARLALAGVLLATVGGFGSIFSLLVSAEIRAYNRVTPFIAYFSLVAVGLILKQLFTPRAPGARVRPWVPTAMAAVFCLGLYDQSHAVPWINREHDDIRLEWSSLTAFVRSLENRLPAGAMVFQMPSSIYLTETGGPGVLRYDHIKPYLVSSRVHWSYPALSDAVVRWQQQVSRLPPAAIPAALLQEGFRAVLIDRNGYRDRGTALLAAWDVQASPGAVLVENDRYVALDLDRMRQVEIPAGWLPRYGAPPVAATRGKPACKTPSAYTIEWIGSESTPFARRPVSVTSSGSTTLVGWAVDTVAGSVAGDVDIVVGGFAWPTLYGGDRSDVADAFKNEAYRQSGFTLRLDGKDLGVGERALTIRILAADRSCYYRGPIIPILVR